MRSRSIACGTLMAGLALLGIAVPLRAADEAPAPVDQPTLTPYETALSADKNGDYEAARTAIDQADKARPNDPPTVILKARILIELRDFAGAKAALESLNSMGELPPEVDKARVLAFGDLNLRRHHFDEATKFYESLYSRDPKNPDIVLKLVYCRVGSSDLVGAAKLASLLKPLDPDHPDYYFAKAAIAQSTTGSDQSTGEEIETARTIYGITVTNRYLKTYLQVFAPRENPAAGTASVPGHKPPAPTGVK